MCCEYCHLKDHTRDTCYKLHEYPLDSSSKKRFGFGYISGHTTANNAQDLSSKASARQSTFLSNYTEGSSSSTSADNTNWMPLQFTKEKYMQILQILVKRPESPDCAMTAGMSSDTETHDTMSKWIIDSRGLSYIFSYLKLLDEFTVFPKDQRGLLGT